jgi:hypothetical protein
MAMRWSWNAACCSTGMPSAARRATTDSTAAISSGTFVAYTTPTGRWNVVPLRSSIVGYAAIACRANSAHAHVASTWRVTRPES